MAKNTFGLLLPEEGIYANVTDGYSPNEVSYSYNTSYNKKPKSDYFGQIDITQYDRLKQQTDERIGALDSTVGAFGRSVGRFGIDILGGIAKATATTGAFLEVNQDKIEDFAYNLSYQDNVLGNIVEFALPKRQATPDNFEPLPSDSPVNQAIVSSDLQETFNNIDSVVNTILDKTNLAPKQGESEVSQQLGSVVGSIGASALLFYTGGAGLVSSTFGASSAGSASQEVLEAGGTIGQSAGYGAGVGVAMGSLERIGLESLMKSWVTKKLGQVAAKAAGREAIQEGSQTASEAAILSDFRNDDLLKVTQDVLESSFYGAVGGLIGYGGARIGRDASVKAYKQYLKDRGVSDSDATFIVENAVVGDDVMSADIKQIVNDETIALMDAYDNGEFTEEKFASDNKKIQTMLENNQNEYQYEKVLSYKNMIVKQALDAGIGVEVAEEAGEYAGTFVNAIANVAEQEGLDIDETVDNLMLRISGEEGVLDNNDVDLSQYEEVTDYNEEDLFNGTLFSREDTPEYFGIKGSYTPTTKVVKLFKSATPDTLIHELSHAFLPEYLRVLKKANRTDDLQQIFDTLGVSDYGSFIKDRQAQENLVELTVDYIQRRKEAPNIASQNLFDSAKNWAIDAWRSIKNLNKDNTSPAIDSFFEKLFNDDIKKAPDLEYLQVKEKQIIDTLKGVMSGKEIATKDGLTLGEIEDLRKGLYARVPKAGRTLVTDIRSAGGIDVNSGLAKALGYSSKTGSEGNLFIKNGYFKDETSFIEYLKEREYISTDYGDTYQETNRIWDEVENLFYNKDVVMNPTETLQQELRESAQKNIEFFRNIIDKLGISNIRELENTLRQARSTLKEDSFYSTKQALYLAQKGIENIRKDYQRYYKAKETKNIKNLQSKFENFVNQSPVSQDEKYRLLQLQKNIINNRTYKDMLDRASQKMLAYQNRASMRLAINKIEKLLKKSKPTTKTQQKFDLERNELFDDLRKYNKLSMGQASAKLESDFIQAPKTVANTLRQDFLMYKALGASNGLDYINNLLLDLEAIFQDGLNSKNAQIVAKLERKKQLKEKLFNGLDKSKYNKSFSWKKPYISFVSNFYSAMNTVFGKEMADTLNFELTQSNNNVKLYKVMKDTKARIKDVYGIKSDMDFLNKMQELSTNKVATLKPIDSRVRFDLSTNHILYIYTSMKNNDLKQSYYEHYGKEVIDGLLKKITSKDKSFADILASTVQSRYDVNSKIFADVYDIPLGYVENYFPSVSYDRDAETDVDIMQKYSEGMQKTPAFVKQRKTVRKPKPVDIWGVFQKYINESVWYETTSKQWKETSDLLNDAEIKNQVEDKFGSDVVASLKGRLDAMSLTAVQKRSDEATTFITRLLNNFIRAKTAINLNIFIGQFPALINYLEYTPATDFIKNITHGIKSKEIKKVMQEHFGDFLEERLGAGYSEDINAILSEGNDLSKKKFSLRSGTTSALSNAMSYLSRYGDIVPIYLGGYARFKYLIDNGSSIEEAKQKVITETRQSQQASGSASLSLVQQNKNLKAFTMFKNTPYQMARKVGDAIVMYQNGEIDLQQATKTIAIYGIINTAVWTMVTNAWKQLIKDDDEDESVFDGVMTNILASPITLMPIFGDIIMYGYKKLLDIPTYGKATNIPIVDDFVKSIDKMYKKDKNIFDWTDILAPLLETFAGVPIQTPKRLIKDLGEF